MSIPPKYPFADEPDPPAARMRPLDVQRIDVWLLGHHNYPERRVRLADHLVADLPDLIAGAQQLNPAVTPEAVVQAIWRLGRYRLQQNLLRRIPLRACDLP
jgi:hypothetical protein